MVGLKQSIVNSDNRDSSPTIRQRRAAYKAWRTIRKKRLKSAAEHLSPIDKYFSIQELSTLSHPELASSRHDDDLFSLSRGIISLFQKTPSDIACGKFWELRWAYGCPLDCNYCYLRGTMRGRMKPSPVKIEHVLNALERVFKIVQGPHIFNTGELSDSLMYPSIMEQIIDKFEEQKKHKVALLSKMGHRNADFLLRKLRYQTICAWSINAIEVSKKWEKAAVTPEERINVAKTVSEIGYDTRIRIDPIFPIDNWKYHYEAIIDILFSKFTPKRIILGTPRGLWKTIQYARKAGVDMSWSQYFGEDSGWGEKLNPTLRFEIYNFFYDKFKSLGYPLSKVTMCKETTDMWKKMGLPYEPLNCNCYGKNAYD